MSLKTGKSEAGTTTDVLTGKANHTKRFDQKHEVTNF